MKFTFLLCDPIIDVLRAIRDFIFNAEAEAVKDITDMVKKLDTLIDSAAKAQAKGVEVEGKKRNSLSDAEATIIIEAMKANAEVAPQLELTPENWIAEFGAEGIVATPIGEVKMSNGQYQKMQQQGRNTKLGMVKPTLTNPDVIIEEDSKPKDGRLAERNSSFVFVKAFTNAEGARDYMFTSVSNLRDGIEIVMSNQEKETPRVKRLLKEGKLAYINEATLPSEFTASAQGDQSTKPSEVSYSDSKDTTSSSKKQAKEQKFSLITPEMDADYLSAVERGDMATAQQMVMETAKMAGYDTDTSYQGSLAFNGAAPSANAYFETKEERKEAWNNDDYDGTMSLGDYADNAIDTNDLEWQLTDRGNYRRAEDYTKESIDNINKAIKGGSHKITIYRAVPNNIEESSVRNGDWVTPSRKYAEFHIGLQDWESGRIIEQEVDVDDIWWNGDDINEWGYDDGSDYGYRNTQNNRKLLDPVTYDDNGNVIPLSERFNQEKEDIRYSLTAPTFYSNAEYAVRNIKQEKATPEQWLKMIEKNGGLKAGEDKWLGLSDWLKASTTKTLTKDEVLQYIADNNFVIEENNTMHSVDVTDAMRESVMQGQPRFSLQNDIDDALYERAAMILELCNKANSAYGIKPTIVVAATREDFVNIQLETGYTNPDRDAIAAYLDDDDIILLNSLEINTEGELANALTHENTHSIIHTPEMWNRLAVIHNSLNGDDIRELQEKYLPDYNEVITQSVLDEIISNFVAYLSTRTEDGVYLLRGYLLGSRDIDTLTSTVRNAAIKKYGDKYAYMVDALLPFLIDILKIQKENYEGKDTSRSYNFIRHTRGYV